MSVHSNCILLHYLNCVAIPCKASDASLCPVLHYYGIEFYDIEISMMFDSSALYPMLLRSMVLHSMMLDSALYPMAFELYMYGIAFHDAWFLCLVLYCI